MSDLNTRALATKQRTYFVMLALLAMLLVSVQLFWGLDQTQKRFDDKVQSLSETLRYTVDDLERQVDESYELMLVHYAMNPEITEKVRLGQRQELYRLLKHEFEAMKTVQPALLTLHFIDANNHSFLRMQAPDAPQNDLSGFRNMVAVASQNRQTVRGFESGQDGFGYRVVTPLYDADNHYLGLLEVGVGLDYFVEQLSHYSGVQTRLLIRSDQLPDTQDYRYFPKIGDYSMVHADAPFKTLAFDDTRQLTQRVHSAGRTYLVLSDMSLGDFDGQPVAKLQMMEDVSDVYDDYLRDMWAQVVLSVLALGVFLWVLRWILQRYSLRLLTAIEEVEALRKSNKVIKRNSEMDELTGAFNRRYFNKQLFWLIQQYDRREPVAILFYDIDHFKQINDTYGHLVGDDILKSLTDYVRRHIRIEDELIRWGGEEFAIILKNVTLEQAVEKAESIRLGVAETHWVQEIRFTISISVAGLQPHDSPKSVQQRLDERLYHAKQSGRNRVEFRFGGEEVEA
ncbi:MAG: diguanylate cyclase [Hydrogenovibrio sp.]